MNKTKSSKKIALIILAIIVGIVLAVLIILKATETQRFLKSEMNEVMMELAEYRSGEDTYLTFYSGYSAKYQDYVDFLAEQTTEMCTNGEYRLLNDFLRELENDGTYRPEVLKVVTDYFETLDLETALEFKDELFLPEEYYNSTLILNRNSGRFASYIQEHGTEEITTTPGTGFYANEKDSSKKDVIGLKNSPLYDAVSITYRGDFKITSQYGVKLNYFYEETHYSYNYYAFRGQGIGFSPDDGECVYSGDYLFCFSPSGDLIDFSKIEKK